MQQWGHRAAHGCRFPECVRPAVFHVLFPSSGSRLDEHLRESTADRSEWEYSNLCRIHTGNALRDGAQSAHQLSPECFDTMYFPAVSTWIVRANRCGLLVTTADPFEGWRLQDA